MEEIIYFSECFLQLKVEIAFSLWKDEMKSLGDPAQHRAATQLKWDSTKENKFFPGASLTAIIITMP